MEDELVSVGLVVVLEVTVTLTLTDHQFDILTIPTTPYFTFIIRSRVLRTISNMMKYSKGLETTTRHSLYLKLSLSFGM